jgi:hypothetical protein
MVDNEEAHEDREDEQDAHIPAVVEKSHALHRSSGSLRSTLLKSKFAWFCLEIAQIVAAINCLAILCGGAYGLFTGIVDDNPWMILASFIGTPIAFILQLAMFIVFAKVSELLRK